MTPYEELFALSEKIKAVELTGEASEADTVLPSLEKAASSVGRAFSGSWYGYHSRVYYNDFISPPPGAHFSQEWGLKDLSFTSDLGSKGDWNEYDADEVIELIRHMAGNPDLTEIRLAAERAADEYLFIKSELISIIQNELDDRSDSFLEGLKAKIEEIEPLSAFEVARRLAPKGQTMTRDVIVLGQGIQTPPHFSILAEVQSLRQSFGICGYAADIAKKAGSHIERRSRKLKLVESEMTVIGTKVFIGHGRSHAWRDLKDFIQDRLCLPFDEFNRVSVAGKANTARLSEMLDAACVAFLVMTSEDEMADGEHHARMNVIHEAGLFQGRLGFAKAIVLLEEGCEEFSNIQGLGQIRFPKGNISAVFEDIRRLLEREGLIK